MENTDKMNLIVSRAVLLGMLVLFAVGCQSDIDVIKPEFGNNNALGYNCYTTEDANGAPMVEECEIIPPTPSEQVHSTLNNLANHFREATNQVRLELNQGIIKRLERINRASRITADVVDIPRESIQVYTNVVKHQVLYLASVVHNMSNYFNDLRERILDKEIHYLVFAKIHGLLEPVSGLDGESLVFSSDEALKGYFIRNGGSLETYQKYRKADEKVDDLFNELTRELNQISSEIDQRTNAVLQLFYEIEHGERSIQPPVAMSYGPPAFYSSGSPVLGFVTGVMNNVVTRDSRLTKGDFILTNININILSPLVSNAVRNFSNRVAEFKRVEAEIINTNGHLSREIGLAERELADVLYEAKQGLLLIINQIITELGKVQTVHATEEFNRSYIQTNIVTPAQTNIITREHYNKMFKMYNDALGQLNDLPVRIKMRNSRADTPDSDSSDSDSLDVPETRFERIILHFIRNVPIDAQIAVSSHDTNDGFGQDPFAVHPNDPETTFEQMRNIPNTNTVEDYLRMIAELTSFIDAYSRFAVQANSSPIYRGTNADFRYQAMRFHQQRLTRLAQLFITATTLWESSPICRPPSYVLRQSMGYILYTLEGLLRRVNKAANGIPGVSGVRYRAGQSEAIEHLLMIARSATSNLHLSSLRPLHSLRTIERLTTNVVSQQISDEFDDKFYDNSGNVLCPIIYPNQASMEGISERIDDFIEHVNDSATVFYPSPLNEGNLSDMVETINYLNHAYQNALDTLSRATRIEGENEVFRIVARDDFATVIEFYQRAERFWRTGNQCVERRGVLREAIGHYVIALGTLGYTEGPGAAAIPVTNERRVVLEILMNLRDIVITHPVAQLTASRVIFPQFRQLYSSLTQYLELRGEEVVCSVGDALSVFRNGADRDTLDRIDNDVEEMSRYRSVLTNNAARERLFIEGTNYQAVIAESLEETSRTLNEFLGAYANFERALQHADYENTFIIFRDDFSLATNFYNRAMNYWRAHRGCRTASILVNESIRHLGAELRDVDVVGPAANRVVNNVVGRIPGISETFPAVTNAIVRFRRLPLAQDVPLTSIRVGEEALTRFMDTPDSCSESSDNSDSGSDYDSSLYLSEFDDMDLYEGAVGGASASVISEYPDIYALEDYIEITTNMSNFLGTYDQLRSFLRTLTPSDIAGDLRLNNILTNMGELDEARTFYSDTQSPWFRGPECLGSAYLYREGIGHILRIISRFDYRRRGQGSGGRYETLDRVLLEGERLLNGHVLSRLRPYHSLERSVDLQHEYRLSGRGFHRSFPCRERRTTPENFLQAMQGDAVPDNFFTNRGVIEELVERINETISMYHSAYYTLTGRSQEEFEIGGGRIEMGVPSPLARDDVFELSLPDDFARIINNFANARDIAMETWKYESGKHIPIEQCEYTRRILMQSIGHFVVMLQDLDYENISGFRVRDTDPRLISLRMLMNLRDQVLLYPLATYSSLHITLRVSHLETLLRGPIANCEASVPEDGDTGITGNLYSRDGQSPQGQKPPPKDEIKREIGSGIFDPDETDIDESEDNPVADEVINTVVPFFNGVMSLVEDEAGLGNETNTSNNRGNTAPNDGSNGTYEVVPDESGEQSSSDSASSEENPVVDGVESLVTGEVIETSDPAFNY